jgi:hypothetical protein
MAVGAASGGDLPSDIAEIFERRGRLRSGDLTLDIRYHNTKQGTTAETRYHVVFDGLKMRVEVGRGSSEGTIVDKTIQCDGKHITYTSMDSLEGKRQTVTIERQVTSDSKAGAQQKLTDPRVLGFVVGPWPTLRSHVYNDVFAFAGSAPSADVKELLDGREHRRIKWDWTHGRHVTLWIDSNNKTISRIELLRTTKSRNVDASSVAKGVLTCGYEKWGPDFPEIVKFQQEVDGNVVATEEIRVLGAKFNTRPAPKEFDLSALDLQPGTIVVDRTGNVQSNGTWDGTKLITASTPTPRTVVRRIISPLGWVIISVSILGLAVVLLVTWLVPKRS